MPSYRRTFGMLRHADISYRDNAYATIPCRALDPDLMCSSKESTEDYVQYNRGKDQNHSCDPHDLTLWLTKSYVTSC